MTRKEKKELKEKKEETAKKYQEKLDSYLKEYREFELSQAGATLLLYVTDENAKSAKKLTRKIKALTWVLVGIGIIAVAITAYTAYMTFYN